MRNRLLRLLLKNCNFLNIDISQSSVSTRLGCRGVFKYDFVTNLLLSLTVKEFRKSVNHRRNYGQEYSVLFFLTHSVLYITITTTASALLMPYAFVVVYS